MFCCKNVAHLDAPRATIKTNYACQSFNKLTRHAMTEGQQFKYFPTCMVLVVGG